MGFSFSEFHSRYRTRIILEWVLKLKVEVGDQYVRRPRKELFETISEAFDANHQVLVCGDYGPINSFINKITWMRLEAGFPLPHVQRAFELYRMIVLPLLAENAPFEDFFSCTRKINECLTYTIERFSQHFQAMHEKEILEHNRRLEEQVKARTSQLRESELKYKTLVEEITDGYFVIQDERIVFANQAFCEMHGYGLIEVTGRKFHGFVSPEDRERIIGVYRKSLGSTRSTPRTFEYLRLTKAGDCFPTEILAKNARYENKPSSIGICRDITERVKMEQRMREAERMAYVGEITASLSHEIRNPLTSVNMNLKILENRPHIQGNDLRRLEICLKEVMRLERILTELLDFAKPMQIKPGRADINQVLVSCVESLDTKFREKELRLIKKLEAGLPELVADVEKLEQAFINLLLNAVEASDRRGRVLVSTESLHQNGSPWVEISIQDQGRGLSREAMAGLFKPFFTTKSTGTGLGLRNVKAIVDGHAGSIHVMNVRPRGACVKIRLPGGDGHVQDTGNR
ncbi:MAG: two-component system sensor histidine kinase NtrB [Thermodesulfobacteriota bacterium]